MVPLQAEAKLKKFAFVWEPKPFEQGAAFLPLNRAKNPLDDSAGLHPESYSLGAKKWSKVRAFRLSENYWKQGSP